MIIDTFKNQKAIEEFSVIVNRDDIRKNKYSFSAGQYFKVNIKYNKLTIEEFELTINELKSSISCCMEKGNRLDMQLIKLLEEIKYE